MAYSVLNEAAATQEDDEHDDSDLTVAGGSIQDKIDQALDPSCTSEAAIASLLAEVDAARFSHPSVNALREKYARLQQPAAPPRRSAAPPAQASHTLSDEDEEEDLEGEEDDAFEVSLDFGQAKDEQKFTVKKGETVGEVKRRMSVSMGVSEEEMAMLMGLSGADDNMTIEESGILKKGAKIRLPRHSGNVAVQFRGKGKFEQVHLDLREGRLVFSDEKTGTDLRDAKVWGCAVSAPKKARKGHKYILRLDLRAGRVDSRDDSKYVLSTTTGSDLNRWQTDLVAYSVLNEEAAMREDDEHDDGSASAKVPEGVPPQPQQAQKFSEGALIRVVGLVNTPQHNGKSGRITAFDSGQGRYLVLVRCIPRLPAHCVPLTAAGAD